MYLEPGQSKEVTFKLSTKDLVFVARNLKWITEPGEFDISIGNQKKR
nr:fibronectin type III-like domain-contianing protein [Pseudopedobacter sp.]